MVLLGGLEIKFTVLWIEYNITASNSNRKSCFVNWPFKFKPKKLFCELALFLKPGEFEGHVRINITGTLGNTPA